MMCFHFLTFDFPKINHSCDCLTDLCNSDWDTAGAEDKIKVGISVTGQV